MVKLFKHVLIIVLVVVGCSSLVYADEKKIQSYMKELDQLDDSQKIIMLKAYIAGQPYDLGYSMVVIAWKESRFGKYMMNLSDGKHGSYGVYHILLDYSMVRNNVNSSWSKSRLAERLINDFDFASGEALYVLKYYRDKHNSKDVSKYYYMFTSYNGGTRALNSSQARSYGEDSILRLAAVQRYFAKHNLVARLEKRNLLLASAK